MLLKNVVKKLLVASLFVSTLSVAGIAIHSHANPNEVVKASALADNYWKSITDTGDGDTLMSDLNSKISVATTISYGGLWDAYKTSDIVPGTTNKIWDMYGGFSFTVTSNQCGSYKKEGDCYNREHSVPKSWFGESTPAYSDLVHLVPTDGKINGMRGNQPFGEVATASYTYSFGERKDGNGDVYQKAGKSQLGTAKNINGVTAPSVKVFEPDDQYKGDFARIYFYFATRYQGWATSTDNGKYMFNTSFPYMTNYGLALMRKWHAQDPVSQKEIDRNDAIESLQGNRNPYVDHPEWANTIFGSNYDASGSNEPSLKVAPGEAEIGVGETLTLTASPKNIEGTNYAWNITEGSDVVEITSTVSNMADIHALKEGTAKVQCTYGGYNRTVTIVVSENASTEVDPPEDDGTIEITKDNFVSAYPSGEATFSHAATGVVFGYEEVANYNPIQFRAYEGVFYNKTTLGQIVSIHVEQYSTYSYSNLRIGFGNTPVDAMNNADTETYSQPASTTAISGSMMPYFCIKNSSSATRITKIIIVYDNTFVNEDSLAFGNKNITVRSAETEELLVASTRPITSWTSSDTTLAIVDNDGTLHALKVGEVVITASDGTLFDTCSVTIIKGDVVITGLSLNESTLDFDLKNETKTAQLEAIFEGQNVFDETVTWSSNNDAVATISSTGLVTAVSVGKTVITATSDTDNSFKASCVVSVINTGSEGDWEVSSVAYRSAYFGNGYDETSNSSYTTTWYSTNAEEDFQYEIKYGNTNSKSWNYVMFGPKNTTSTGHVKTTSAIDKPIGRVAININSITQYGTIDSLQLLTSVSSNFANATTYDFDYSDVGETSVYIDEPEANLYYKVEITCTSNQGSKGKNGIASLSYVKFFDAQRGAVVINEAEEFANEFMGLITCDETGVDRPVFQEGYGWNYFAERFDDLDPTEQAVLHDADPIENSSDIIEQAMYRYEYIIAKYGISSYPNFINRNLTISVSSNTLFKTISSENTTAIIVIIALVGVTSIGTVLTLRRKKEN
ncbi:MAG: endonuclease [Bacilli bacterium]|nr:endonuclease [Bacilli bacterium]